MIVFAERFIQRTCFPVVQCVRNASKKAGGGSANKNPKRSRGQGYGILKWEGSYVYEGDYLVKQNRLRYHPGMNVKLHPWYIKGSQFIRATKEGTVVFTSEMSDLNWDNSWVQMFYASKDPQTNFPKKYIHVIPKAQHTRFKCIDNI